MLLHSPHALLSRLLQDMVEKGFKFKDLSMVL